MFSVFRSVFSLILSYGLLMVAIGLFNSLISLRANLEGISTTWVGVIMSSQFVGMLLGGLFAAQVIALVGHIRAFAAFASTISIAALCHPLFIDVSTWMGLRLMSGFCFAGMIIVTESWLNERAGTQYRGGILALYMMANYLASGSGQLLLKFGDISTFQLFSIASIIFSLALLPILLTRNSPPLLERGERISIFAVIKLGPLAVFGIFCTGLINASINSLSPIYAMAMFGTQTDVANFTALLVASGFILQWPIGRLSDKVGRGTMVAGVATVIAICSIAVMLSATFSKQLLLVMAVVYGAFLYTLYSLCSALINDVVGPELRIRVASSLLIVYGVGAVIGPSAAGFLIAELGPQALFGFSLVVSTSLAGYAVYRRVYQAIFIKPVQPFVPVPTQQAPSDELYLVTQAQQEPLPGASVEENIQELENPNS